MMGVCQTMMQELVSGAQLAVLSFVVSCQKKILYFGIVLGDSRAAQPLLAA
jgi:hypothetical protein